MFNIKKIKKYLKISILFYSILFLIIMILLESILSMFGMIFRNWLFYTSILIFIISFIIGWIQIIIRLKNGEFKIAMVVVTLIGVVVSFIISPYIFLLYAFGYTPEYVVTINQTKYVAEVNSFLEVEVNYHKYINWFVRGKETICSEDYGNGGYDPFIDKDDDREPRSRCFKII